MVNNLSAQTRCCAGPLPAVQVSLCVSGNVQLGEGPLPVPYFLGGFRLVAKLEKLGESTAFEHLKEANKVNNSDYY